MKLDIVAGLYTNPGFVLQVGLDDADGFVDGPSPSQMPSDAGSLLPRIPSEATHKTAESVSKTQEVRNTLSLLFHIYSFTVPYMCVCVHMYMYIVWSFLHK